MSTRFFTTALLIGTLAPFAVMAQNGTYTAGQVTPAPAGAPPALSQPQPAPAGTVPAEVHTQTTIVSKPMVSPSVVPAPQGAGAIPPMPLKIITKGNITYISGGVSDEELAMLKQHESEFNTQLLLTGIGGAYLSGAIVRITDSTGAEVLMADHIGPYLYVSLKPGKYTFEVTAKEGGIKKADVTVPASGTVKPIMRFTE